MYSLAAVFAAVALAPLLATWSKRFLTIPLPVVEMVLGMLIGPAALGLVQVEPGGLLQVMGQMGISAILFIAGYELEYRRISRREFGWASGGWILSIVLAVAAGIGVAFAFNAGGLEITTDNTVSLITAGVFIGIALTSTALSTSLPALRDARETTTKYGRAIIASGTVGQLAPLLAISVVFGGRNVWWSAGALLIFLGLLLLAVRASRHGLPSWMRKVVTITMHTSGHFAIRLVVAIVAILAALSINVFGINMLVGAFAAGMLVRHLMGNVEREERILIEHKFQSLAFGLLTPLFFISNGVTFDIPGLIAEPLALVLVPVFMLIMLLARGFPGSLVLPRGSSGRDRFAAMFWTSLGLAVIVVIVNVAIDAGALTPVIGSAMVGAGMLSLLSFPTAALAIRRGRTENDLNPAIIDDHSSDLLTPATGSSALGYGITVSTAQAARALRHARVHDDEA